MRYTKMTKAKFRRLVVRAIEDTILVMFIVFCAWAVCSGIGFVLKALGVGA